MVPKLGVLLSFKSIPKFAAAFAVSALAAGFACSSSPRATTGVVDAGPPPMPFQADAPGVYVAKVKNVLVGLPPTADEVSAVEADASALSGLVDGWMKLPQYQAKMLRFFELAFQQTQVSVDDFSDQTYPQHLGLNAYTAPQLAQNAQQSFARTMIQLLAEGAPLNAGMTTQKLMMTTAMKELYAFLDTWEVDDSGAVTDHFRQANPDLEITVEASKGPIPLAESVDPTSPNFMHWYDPDVTIADSQVPGCLRDPIVFPADAMTIHYLLYGTLDNRTGGCGAYGGSASAAQVQASDFSDWTMVTLRPPNAGEQTTTFYDLPSLRSATELVLNVPRVGFFSTPAFFANWQTNTSNQARVTTHQALIVATGSSIDGTDTTVPPGTPGLDALHAGLSACYTCHAILDPTRSIFAATYSWNYHSQLDPTWTGQPGVFAFRGVIQPVHSMADFGNALANHPLFASGWAQKLCYYVNSAPCAPTDLQQFAATFTSSNFSWDTLVKAVVTSPVTTNAEPTATSAANGEVVAISRRDHLCAALDARLGYADVCGLQATSASVLAGAIPTIVSGLPSDAYGRGAPVPVLPTQPTLFFRAATEDICGAIAAQVIDAGAKAPAGVKQWSSGDSESAIADFVSIVMGLTPSDPRWPPAKFALEAHYAAALQQTGTTPTAALQSTFVVACLAPSAVSIGM